MAVRSDNIYGIDTDELGVQSIVRLAVAARQ